MGYRADSSAKKGFQQTAAGRRGCYDQWRVRANSGTVSVGGVVLPAGGAPYYSVHAVGGQLNYILPTKNFSAFFKYYHEYSASSHTVGNTICFGGSWTLLIPKPKPAAPKS
jgi:hypothetical protein